MTDVLLEKMKSLILDYNMLPREGTVLCAVSGGVDSMCLLLALRELGVKVCAAHFNHCLRGAESDGDEEFVKSWCEENNIAFKCGRGDVAAYAKKNRLGTEEAARILRYGFLESAADEAGAAVIATAHNADDNAETLIFNLTRGTALKGLCGIPPVRGRIIRPLLSCPRCEIERYAKERNLPHVEDSTNSDTIYSRNKIRHLVMPVLRNINPSFAESAFRTSEALREDESCLDALSEEIFANAKIKQGRADLSTDLLKEQSTAIRSRVIRKLAEAAGGYMDSCQTKAVEKLLFSVRPSAGADIGGGVRLRREYGLIVAARASLQTRSFSPIKLSAGHSAEIKELGLSLFCEYGVKTGKIHKTFNNLLFKKSAIRGNITVRPRESGDYIRLSGRNVGKSLKKLFIEEHIPAAERALIPVFADDEGVVAVYGVGVSERATPEDGDEIIEITLRDGTV